MFQKMTLIVILFALVSCKDSDTNEKEKIKAAKWLLGSWASKSAEGTLTESWTKVNDSVFKATSYFSNEKDTIHFETITLQQKGDLLTYTATVKGQNNDKPVVFTLKNATAKQMIFENLQNDYPRTITYKQVSNKAIVATISGIQQGKASSEQFVLKK